MAEAAAFVSPKFTGQRIPISRSGRMEVHAITIIMSLLLNRLERNDF